MRKIQKSAYAGTLESSDVFVQIEPISTNEIKIELESSVLEMYGEDITTLIQDTITKLEVSFVHVKVQDKGALDYVIKARLQSAVSRALDETTIEWEKL